MSTQSVIPITDDIDHLIGDSTDLEEVWDRLVCVLAEHGLIGDKQASLIKMSAAKPEETISIATEEGLSFTKYLHCWIVGTESHGYWILRRNEAGQFVEGP